MEPKHYAMCPACGRSIPVDEDSKRLRPLWDDGLSENAQERGGDVWGYALMGRVPGGKLAHKRSEAPQPLVRRVLRELRRRCKEFLRKTRPATTEEP